MSQPMLVDGPDDSPITIMLAHGAGATMDSNSMNATAAALAAVGFRVVRFEFDYMAARRAGQRKTPPRAEKLIPEYVAAIDAFDIRGRLIIGGKSMSGRVASMVADELYAAGRIAGLLCLGYPFHPPGKPEQLRTGHLAALQTPTLICQGARDEFGTPAEVAGYDLATAIELLWLEDGDHDLKPRKTISGFTAADHLMTVAMRVQTWATAL